MIRKYLVPDLYVDNVYEVNYEKLLSNGIKLIIFDIDNTLKTYDEKVPSEENIKLILKLKSIGFEVCLLSNGRKSRVENYNNDLNLKAIHLGLKPLKFNIKRLLKEFKVKNRETAIIGDQIFTDVLVGKRMKITTILVKPIKPKKTFIEKIKRNLEKVILKLYNNTQCL